MIIQSSDHVTRTCNHVIRTCYKVLVIKSFRKLLDQRPNTRFSVLKFRNHVFTKANIIIILSFCCHLITMLYKHTLQTFLCHVIIHAVIMLHRTCYQSLQLVSVKPFGDHEGTLFIQKCCKSHGKLVHECSTCTLITTKSTNCNHWTLSYMIYHSF